MRENQGSFPGPSSAVLTRHLRVYSGSSMSLNMGCDSSIGLLGPYQVDLSRVSQSQEILILQEENRRLAEQLQQVAPARLVQDPDPTKVVISTRGKIRKIL